MSNPKPGIKTTGALGFLTLKIMGHFIAKHLLLQSQFLFLSFLIARLLKPDFYDSHIFFPSRWLLNMCLKIPGVYLQVCAQQASGSESW